MQDEQTKKNQIQGELFSKASVWILNLGKYEANLVFLVLLENGIDD